ncbi:MAG: hypothetical protein NVS3B2_08630 [Ramlibacter sp.]
MNRHLCIRSWAGALALALLGPAAPAALAQSFCSSDGRTQPASVLERFISADCEACWASAADEPRSNELALDWIVPGSKGDDAPLSAAASRDALARLEALQRQVPAAADSARRIVQAPKRGLRVSHGLPFNGYIGTSIELKLPTPGTWSAWLLLVETIPAGADGTPVARNLVRNTLRLSWGGTRPLTKDESRRLFESRPMSIPEGAKPDRLRVVGWVEDTRGRMRAIAQSRCSAAAPGG